MNTSRALYLLIPGALVCSMGCGLVLEPSAQNIEDATIDADGGMPDGGQRPAVDAGASYDSGPEDAGGIDAGGIDAGGIDAGGIDAGGPILGTVGRLSAGSGITCAEMMGNEQYCWGKNANGELGDDTTNDSYSPRLLTVISGEDATDLSPGWGNSCAFDGEQQVNCWGLNNIGQLGDGSMADRLTPGPVSSHDDVMQLTRGEQHRCALLVGGVVECWGANESSQLGDGMRDWRSTPVGVAGLTDAVEVRAGQSHTCARRDDYTVECWGLNELWQTGDPTVGGYAVTPTGVVGVNEAVELRVGGHHSCVRTNEQVQCWGANEFGQLGHGNTSERGEADFVAGPAGAASLEGIEQIALGDEHSCARNSIGLVYCWGRNSVGQLGTSTGAYQDSPVLVPGLTGVIDIAAGADHTCALQMDGAIFCWGGNAYGQLGNGISESRSPPSRVLRFGSL